jgi:peptidoglycan/LPS O-acetylase OafA/YrhL
MVAEEKRSFELPDDASAAATGTVAAKTDKVLAEAHGFQIPSLDGLRACSFLIVFLAHAGLGSFVPGYFGLSLFFFLSGYLITTLMRLEVNRSGTVNLKQFYLRRVLRIFPPFYLVLLAAIACTELGVMPGSVSVNGVLAQVLHVTNYWVVLHGWWDGLAPGTWVYWSLAVEEHFYLFFPLLFLFLHRSLSPAGRVRALLALCALVLAWRCVLIFGFHVQKDRTYVASDTRVDSILAGCVLAIWRNPVLDGGWSDRALKFGWLPLGLLSVLVSLAFRRPWFEQTFRYTLQSFGLLPVFVALILWHDRGPIRVLNFRPMKYLGLLSYSMYLMHTALLWGLESRTHLPTAIRSTLALGIVIGVAALLYHYVEKPCARLRRRLSRYVEARPPAVPAA